MILKLFQLLHWARDLAPKVSAIRNIHDRVLVLVKFLPDLKDETDVLRALEVVQERRRS
jgi:hypothetical protein